MTVGQKGVSADCGNNTDHRLVAATCSLRLKRSSLPQYTSPPIAVEKLLDPTTQRNFVLKLRNRFALLSESDESASSIDNLWKEGRNALKETSHAVLGLRHRKKHQWISDETLGTIDEHSTALYVATRSWHDVLLPNANNNYDEMKPSGTAA